MKNPIKYRILSLTAALALLMGSISMHTMASEIPGDNKTPADNKIIAANEILQDESLVTINELAQEEQIPGRSMDLQDDSIITLNDIEPDTGIELDDNGALSQQDELELIETDDSLLELPEYDDPLDSDIIIQENESEDSLTPATENIQDAATSPRNIYTKFISTSNTGGQGTSSSPYGSFNTALANANDGDTIIIIDKAFYNDTTGMGAPMVIDHAITITGQTGNGSEHLATRSGGIVLKADVTFENLQLSLENGTRNGIIANGHELTLTNVRKYDGSRLFNIYGGTAAGASVSSGSKSVININGKTSVEHIFAGSHSHSGSSAASSLPVDININPGVSGVSSSKLTIYGTGAYQPPYDGLIDGIATKEPPIPTGDLRSYPVNAKVNINVATSLVKEIYAATSPSSSASITFKEGEGYANNGALIHDGENITVNSGKTEISAGSTLTGNKGNITVNSGAALDIGGFQDSPAINNFSGGGSLIIGKNQCLSIGGSVTGRTCVGIDEIFNGKSGLANEGNTYIECYSASKDSFYFTGANDRQPGMALLYYNGLWIASAQGGTGPTDPSAQLRIKDIQLEGSSFSANADNFIYLPVKVKFSYEDPTADDDLDSIPFTVAVSDGSKTYTGKAVDGAFYEYHIDELNMKLSWYGVPGGFDDATFLLEYLDYTRQGKIPGGTYNIVLTIPKEYTVSGKALNINFTFKFTNTSNPGAPVQPGGDTDPSKPGSGEGTEPGSPEDFEDDGAFRVVPIKDEVYTGNALKPTVNIYEGRKLLDPKKDYTLTYKNNIKAGTATVTIAGKGNYSGKRIVNFKILPADISGADVSDITKIYTKKKISPAFVLKYNGKTLKSGTDYTTDLANVDCINPGTKVVTFTGKGNFNGSIKANFIILENKVLMSSVTAAIVKGSSLAYADDKAVEPPVTVTYKKTPLIKGTDYNVTYENNKEPGKAYVVLTGLGVYSGTKKISFTITGGSLSKAKVTIPSQVYTGSEITPATVLTISDKTLRENVDYTRTFSNNTKVGTATVVFSGLGAYKGTSLKKTFKITATLVTSDGVAITVDPSAQYHKGGAKANVKVTFKGNVLKEGSDYTLSYSNNSRIGIATVKVVGKGILKGKSTALNFQVTPNNLDNTEIYFNSKAYNAKPGSWKLAPVITDSNGKKLTAGTDYEKVIKYTDKNGNPIDAKATLAPGSIVHATITPKSVYGTASRTVSYTLIGQDISKAKITFAGTYTYTGNEIRPVPVVTIGSGDSLITLKRGTDFKVKSYSKNIPKGTASAVIEGIGNYCGRKTGTFKIVGKSLNN